MENIFVEFLPPWVETGLQPAFYDKESGTVLQQTARMYARVNMLIRMFNKLSKTTKTTVEDYIERFNELYTYVHDYFDNLDVQEEINNKLDEMVEDGTLAELIDNYYNNSVKIIFAKCKGEIQSGDISLLKTLNKNVLIDTHLATQYNKIESFLIRNGVEHIDYLILTHYHNDHIGNVINLINDNYITVDSVVYLPGYSTLISDNPTITADYLAITQALTQLGCTVIQPTEGMTLTVDDTDFTFYNCTQAVFEEEGYTDYNDCSTVVEVNNGGAKALFTGDITNKPFIRFNRLKMFNYKINLYKIEHHGIYNDSRAIPLLNRITPDYAYQPAELGDFVTGSISQGTTTQYLKNKNCKIYSTYSNQNDIIFEMNNKTVIPIQGVENYSASNRLTNVDIYVDNSVTSEIRDGSAQNPYKEIQEAICRIPQNEHCQFTLYLADGDYGEDGQGPAVPKIAGSTKIIINGDSSDRTAVKLHKSFWCRNGASVYFNDVTFVNQAAYITESNVEFYHCNFNNTGVVASSPVIEAYDFSNVKILGCNFYDQTIAIVGHKCNIESYYNVFNNMDTAIKIDGIGWLMRKSNTFTNCSNEVSLINGAIEKSQDMVLSTKLCNGAYNIPSGSSYLDITLSDDVDKFDELHMYFGKQGKSSTYVCNDINQSKIRVGDTFYHFAYYNYVENGTVKTAGVKFSFINKTTMRILEYYNQSDVYLRTVIGVSLPTSINK